MMDCDTTGIEPDLALVKFKKMVGGGSMQIVNQTVPLALKKLGYTDETIEAIVNQLRSYEKFVLFRPLPHPLDFYGHGGGRCCGLFSAWRGRCD